MSKKWKFAIGVIAAILVVGGLGLLHLSSVIYWSSGGERGWSPRAYISELIWGPGTSEYIPSFGRGLAMHKGEAGTVSQFEVRLVDDDGDGVPDRGVIEAPAGLPFGPGFSPGHRLPFGPGHGLHFGRGFGPFFVVGSLFRLAFLALLIGLAVAFFHRWSQAKEAREPERG
jgi:hypothetical protein